MWCALGRRLAVVVLVLAAAACSPEPTVAPSAPPGAVRVNDWREFDQERANQPRVGPAELVRRFPRGQTLETLIWHLPSTATWDQVRAHYAQQTDWRPDDVNRAAAGPVLPDMQVLVDARRVTRLDIALFRARSGTADAAVLIVERSRF